MRFRPSHQTDAGPNERCKKCGLWGYQHDRKRAAYVASYNAANPRPAPSLRIIGVDGEGQGRSPHVYNFLGAADEDGKTWQVGNDPSRTIGSERCLDFLLSLPARSLVFGFAFFYDLTKILEDLPDETLYLLLRPNKRRLLRKGKVVLEPMRWGPYSLNYVQRRFSVKRDNRRATVWDIFAFYQRRFTEALRDWKAAPITVIERMEEMKAQRGGFHAEQWEEIKEYCLGECSSLAKLGRKLITAHNEAGFPLRDYYGAGSTASSLLRKYGVLEYRGETPDAMREALACSFFGGRFENSIIGRVPRRVYGNDISSAYPYAATFLPCLVHGRWRRWSGREINRAMERETLLLVNWHLPKGPDAPWGPLPVRKADGTIAFPLGATGGWVWKREFQAAARLRPDVIAREAWGYHTDCTCQPFAFLPDVYLERLRIGKEGPGQVLKLGPNSVYGKLAQAVGSAKFQCWVWASLITSSCRAQILNAILAASDPSHILMIATDGIFSDVRLVLPKPIDTGTDKEIIDLEGKRVRKPLGGWEETIYEDGIFAARPGVYFPIMPPPKDEEEEKKQVSKMKARGLGRKVLYERRNLVMSAFDQGLDAITVIGGERFIGAKSGIHYSKSTGYVRSPHYGDWVEWPMRITFDPKPKRCERRADNTLVCWPWFQAPSLPYEKAMRDPEAELMELAKVMMEEQPDFEMEVDQ